MYSNFVINRQYRYYQYYELNSYDPIVVSYEEILSSFYTEWSDKMIKKYGLETFKSTYSYEDCIDDFCSLHLAIQI